MTVRGVLSYRKHQLSSPTKQIAFRSMNLSLGRYDADLVRRTLQKVLITGKPRSEVRFERTIELSDSEVIIRDRIDASRSRERFARILRGSDATSIYVANSNTFQESVLLPWVDLSAHAEPLNRDRRIELPERRLSL